MRILSDAAHAPQAEAVLTPAIEVDGFQFHENSPEQLRRDALKNAICATYEIPLLRLPTTGTGEECLIRNGSTPS